jgi:hypothetical protein
MWHKYNYIFLFLWAFHGIVVATAQEVPTNLVPELIGEDLNNVQLTWDFNDGANPDFQGFRIYRNNSVIINNLQTGIPYTYTDIQLPTGTYFYEIMAVYDNGVSDRSERSDVTIREPDDYHFQLGSGDPNVTWTIYIHTALLGQQSLSPGDEVAVFDIDSNKLAGRTRLTTQTLPANALVPVICFSQFADSTGYTAGNSFSFQLYDASRDTVYAESVYTFQNVSGAYTGNVFPSGGDPFSVAELIFSLGLPAPQNLAASHEGHDITLTWELEENLRNLKGYLVFRDDSLLTPEEISGNSYTDEEVISGTYQYYVIADYDEGSSLPSEALTYDLSTVYYLPENESNTTAPMMLFVHQADIMHEALVLFDEIGVFRVAGGDTLCMAAYSLTNDFNNDVSFLLPADHPQTVALDGFETGDSLYFGLYRYDEARDYRHVLLTFPAGHADTSAVFVPNSDNHVQLRWVPYAPVAVDAYRKGYNIHLQWEDNPKNEAFQPLSYILYRNGIRIDTVPFPQQTYLDGNMLVDSYTYQVQGLYADNVSSRLSDTAMVEIPLTIFTAITGDATAPGNMTFFITGAEIDGNALDPVDEIGLFTTDSSEQELCIGAGSLHYELDADNTLEIHAAIDNPDTPEKDGFLPGDSIRYKLGNKKFGINYIYHTITHTFPSDTALGFNHDYYSSGDTCYVSLAFNTPPPVRFFVETEGAYCKDSIGHIFIMTEDFTKVSSFHLVLNTDNAHYNFTEVISNQPDINELNYQLYADSLVIDWGGEGVSLDDGSTLLDIVVQPIDNGNATVSWHISQCHTTGMELQEALFTPGAFYIERKPYAPGQIFGDDQVCTGSTFSTYAINAISNAESYNWFMIPDTAGNLITSANGTQADLYWNENLSNITVQLGVAGQNYCGTGDTSLKVIEISNTVVAGVTIQASETEVCEDEAVTFYANWQNGGNNPQFTWFLNGAPAPGVMQNNDTVTYDGFEDGDDVYCRFTSSSACATNNPAISNTISLTVNPKPTVPSILAGPDSVGSNVPEVVFVTAGAAYVEYYQWLIAPASAGTITGQGTNQVNGLLTWNPDWLGNARVMVRAMNACGGGPYLEKIVHRYYVDPTAITDIGPNTWKIYPNPVRNRLYYYFSTSVKRSLAVYSSHGKLVRHANLTQASGELDVSVLPKGLYLLVVQSANGVSRKWFVKL